MRRWNRERGEDVEDPAVDAFLADLAAVCRKHGMSLGHEDHHGVFEVYRQVFPDALDWMMGAHIAEWTD